MQQIGFPLLIYCVIVAAVFGDIPGCDYFDTVDLTNSQLNNGFYKYEDIDIPEEKTGTYNYQILFNGETIIVPDHTRGCACQLKSCVRLCCDPQSVISEDTSECIKNATDSNLTLNITLNNDSEVEVNPFNRFIVQTDFNVTCDNIFLHTGEWTLFENGILFNGSSNFGKGDYCLQPKLDENNQQRFMPYMCDIPITLPDDHGSFFIKLMSIFFLILTIAVHFSLPEFNSRHSKFCIFYFICLAISFSILRLEYHFQSRLCIEVCSAIGHIGYYFVMATFLWLLVINFNLWLHITSLGKMKEFSILKSNIFVWVVAGIFLLITSLVDQFNTAEPETGTGFSLWKPGFAQYDCWIKTTDESALIFFHGPIFVLLLINIIFFTLSARHIVVETKNNHIYKGDIKRKNHANFLTFLRFFIIAGLIWTIEVYISLCTIYTSTWDSSWLTLINSWIDNILNGQGVIIFVATVSRKKVLRDLYIRFLSDSKTHRYSEVATSN